MSFNLWKGTHFSVSRLRKAANPLLNEFKTNFDPEIFSDQLVAFHLAVFSAASLMGHGRGNMSLCFEIAEAFMGKLPALVVVGNYVVSEADLAKLNSLNPQQELKAKDFSDPLKYFDAVETNLLLSVMEFRSLFSLMMVVRAGLIKHCAEESDPLVWCSLFIRLFVYNDPNTYTLDALHLSEPFCQFFNVLAEEINAAPKSENLESFMKK